MITFFSVKNFRQFKDELVFDFSSIRDYQFNTECVKDHLNEKSDRHFNTKILKKPRQFGAKLDILFVVIVFALNVIIARCPEREQEGWSRDKSLSKGKPKYPVLGQEKQSF